VAGIELRQVTLRLPGDTLLPVPHGRWQRLSDGTLLATFGAQDLEWALLLGKEALRCRRSGESGAPALVASDAAAPGK